MATYVFTLLSTSMVTVLKDGVVNYKPRNMVPSIDGDNITFSNPDNVNYDFTVTTSDTITAEGNSVSGTAEEIADALCDAIFFIPASGGTGAVLDQENTFSENQSIIKNQAGLATKITVRNDNATGAASFLGFGATSNQTDMTADQYGAIVQLFGGNSSAILLVNNEGNGTASAGKVQLFVSSPDPMELSSNGGFNFLSQIILGGGIANYADDAAAATGGVPVGGLYRTASALKIRVA